MAQDDMVRGGWVVPPPGEEGGPKGAEDPFGGDGDDGVGCCHDVEGGGGEKERERGGLEGGVKLADGRRSIKGEKRNGDYYRGVASC